MSPVKVLPQHGHVAKVTQSPGLSQAVLAVHRLGERPVVVLLRPPQVRERLVSCPEVVVGATDGLRCGRVQEGELQGDLKVVDGLVPLLQGDVRVPEITVVPSQ